MSDFIYVAVIIALFAVCVLYVNWCDRIVGPVDDGSAGGTGTPSRSSDATETSNTTKEEVSV